MENTLDSTLMFQVRVFDSNDTSMKGNYFGRSVGLFTTEQEAQECVDSLKGQYKCVYYQSVCVEG